MPVTIIPQHLVVPPLAVFVVCRMGAPHCLSDEEIIISAESIQYNECEFFVHCPVVSWLLCSHSFRPH